MHDELTLPRFARQLSAFGRNIGDPARAAAKTCLADALACASAGTVTDAHRWSAAALEDLGDLGARDARDAGGSSASVWFTGRRAGVLTAAYLNSVAVSAHDLDDGHRGAIGHPGGAVIPAVLAEIEHSGSSVDPLDAIAFGYEAAVRIAEQRDPGRLERTATGRWASFASAAVSCYLAGDPPETLAAALAHAGSLAPQLAPPDRRATDGLKEGTPWAVVAGLVAARIARAGLPGPTYVLERRRAFTAEGLARIAPAPPGAVTETYFKRYACCRWIHPVLDCLFALHATEPIVPDLVDAIDVLTFERSLRLGNLVAPVTLEDAHYSFPFCIGLALTAGAEAFLPIAPEALTSAPALRLAEKVRLTVDPILDRAFPERTPAAVRVTTRHGVRELHVETAHGDPALPFPAQVLRHKHRHLIGRWCPQQVDRIDTLLDPEAGPSVDLPRLLTAVAASPRPVTVQELRRA